MRKITAFLLLLMLAGSVVASAGPSSLESILPADTDLLIVIHNVPSCREKGKTGPWGRLWNDPELKPFTEVLSESLDVENWDRDVAEATGLTLTEILDNFTGQAAIVFPDLQAVMEADETGDEPPFAFIAELSDAQVLTTLMGKDLEKEREKRAEKGQTIREIEETLHGATIHVRMLKENGEESEWQAWAQADGIAVAGEPVSYVRDLVAAIKGNPPRTPLAGRAEYQRMRERIGESDAYCYLNLSTFAAALLAEVAEHAADAETPTNPMGIDEHAVIDALALDAFQGLFVSAAQGAKDTRVDAGLFYREERGIAKLLAYPPGPVDRPDFIPQDVMGVSVGRFSMEQFWDGMLEIVTAINPGLTSTLQTQLDQISLSLGVNIEQDVFRNFGEDGFGAYIRSGDNELQQVVGIKVRDTETMTQALDGILAMVGGMSEMPLFTPREVHGATVYAMDAIDMEDFHDTVSYTLTHGYLLIGIGGPHALDQILGAMEKPGTSIWERADVKRHLTGLPEDTYMLAYYDTPQLIHMVYEKVLAELEEDENADFDLGDLPSAEVLSRYFGATVEYGIKTPEGLFGTARLVHAEP